MALLDFDLNNVVDSLGDISPIADFFRVLGSFRQLTKSICLVGGVSTTWFVCPLCIVIYTRTTWVHSTFVRLGIFHRALSSKECSRQILADRERSKKGTHTQLSSCMYWHWAVIGYLDWLLSFWLHGQCDRLTNNVTDSWKTGDVYYIVVSIKIKLSKVQMKTLNLRKGQRTKQSSKVLKFRQLFFFLWAFKTTQTCEPD